MNLSPLIPPYAVQMRPLKKDATDNPIGILTTLFVLITFLYHKHKKKLLKNDNNKIKNTMSEWIYLLNYTTNFPNFLSGY